MYKKLSKNQINEIYELLVDYAGYQGCDKETFISYFLGNDTNLEWRFMGYFGFGGKLYANSSAVYIDYYREHKTHILDSLRDLINDRIKDIIK